MFTFTKYILDMLNANLVYDIFSFDVILYFLNNLIQIDL
jgi:hypothetical protein